MRATKREDGELTWRETGHLLAELQEQLYGGDYAVSLFTACTETRPEQSIEGRIAHAMPFKAPIKLLGHKSTSHVLQTVEDCLWHTGDQTYGPNAGTLSSTAFQSNVTKVLECISRWCAPKGGAWEFGIMTADSNWYSVWWEFSYAFEVGEQIILLAGFASD
jgi:hypothetical protein